MIGVTSSQNGEREISYEEASETAKRYGITYFEISTVSQYNIRYVLEDMASNLVRAEVIANRTLFTYPKAVLHVLGYIFAILLFSLAILICFMPIYAIYLLLTNQNISNGFFQFLLYVASMIIMCMPNLIMDCFPHMPGLRKAPKWIWIALSLLSTLFLFFGGIYFNIHVLVRNINNKDYDRLRANIIHYIVYSSIGLIMGTFVFGYQIYKTIKTVTHPQF